MKSIKLGATRSKGVEYNSTGEVVINYARPKGGVCFVCPTTKLHRLIHQILQSNLNPLQDKRARPPIFYGTQFFAVHGATTSHNCGIIPTNDE